MGIIYSDYEIGDIIHPASVERILETRPCPVCDGTSHLETTDHVGGLHEVPCPNRTLPWDDPSKCRHGQTDAGTRHFAAGPRELTIGRIQVTVGGLDAPHGSNMGGARYQTNGHATTVMCYETGIGSGNIWTPGRETLALNGRGASKVCHTAAEAVEWGDAMVKYLDDRLEGELLHAEALDMDIDRTVNLEAHL